MPFSYKPARPWPITGAERGGRTSPELHRQRLHLLPRMEIAAGHVPVTYDFTVDAWVINVGAGGVMVCARSAASPPARTEDPAARAAVPPARRRLALHLPCCGGAPPLRLQPWNRPGMAAGRCPSEASSQRDRDEMLREAIVYCKKTTG